MSSKLNKLIQNNIQYKQQLNNLCQLIEEQITDNATYTNIDKQEDYTDNQINNYKVKINNIKQEIEYNCSIVSILNSELELQEYKNFHKQLQKEYFILKNIRNQQLKEIEKLNKINSFKFKGDKLKHLKEELSLMTDFNKSLSFRIRKQNDNIIMLEDTIHFIKDNIENKKQKQSKEQRNITQEIETIKQQLEEEEILIQIEEQKYIDKINHKQNELCVLNNEIQSLTKKLKQKEQQNQLTNLQYKQLIYHNKIGKSCNKDTIQIKYPRIYSAQLRNNNLFRSNSKNNSIIYTDNNRSSNNNKNYVRIGLNPVNIKQQRFNFKKRVYSSYNINNILNYYDYNRLFNNLLSRDKNKSFKFSKEKRKKFLTENNSLSK